jgi:hypothetical protein
MKPFDRQKLDLVNQTRSNSALRDWRAQFAPEFVARDLRTAVNSILSAQSL